MSKRQHISQKLHRYGEVRTMLVAMQNIALMESRKLTQQIDRQTHVLERVTQTAGEFVAAFNLWPQPEETITIVVGTERGFCGEFNLELARWFEQSQIPYAQTLLVGSRLVEWIDDDTLSGIPGAVVTEELPTVLFKITDWLQEKQKQFPGKLLTIQMMYQDQNFMDPLLKTIAPLPLPEQPERPQANKPLLNLAPADFLSAFGEQALILSIEAILAVSLACENLQRLQHMQAALQRLDERTDILTKKMNAARQEDIIQEIETILLGL